MHCANVKIKMVSLSVKRSITSTLNRESADITTATLHFVCNDSNIQTKAELIPSNWRNKNTVEQTHVKMNSIRESSASTFRSYRLKFIDQIIAKVVSENDDVEKLLIAKQSAGRICSNESCDATFDSLKRKCNLCGAKIVKKSAEVVNFANNESLVTAKTNLLQTNVVKNSVTLKMGEPIMLNPNSYVTVKAVLDSLKEELVQGGRKWVVLGCDGPPYCLGSRIIDANPDEYEAITTTTGLGHLHMNEMKALFKVLNQILFFFFYFFFFFI